MTSKGITDEGADDAVLRRFEVVRITGAARDAVCTGSHSIRFTGRDIVEVSRLLEFLGEYSAELTP